MVKTFGDQGSGTSPILVGDLLLLDVHLEKESYLLAVRAESGETAWKTPKPEFNGGWATPVVWKEKEETLVGVLNPGRFTAYGLSDGRERWWIGDLPHADLLHPRGRRRRPLPERERSPGGEGQRDAPATVRRDARPLRREPERPRRSRGDPGDAARDGPWREPGEGDTTVREMLRFVSEDPTPPTSYGRDEWEAVLKKATAFVQGPIMDSSVLAVRVGGKGDVGKSHVAWTESRGVPEVPSPLLYKDRLYLVKNGGIVIAREARNRQDRVPGPAGSARRVLCLAGGGERPDLRGVRPGDGHGFRGRRHAARARPKRALGAHPAPLPRSCRALSTCVPSLTSTRSAREAGPRPHSLVARSVFASGGRDGAYRPARKNSTNCGEKASASGSSDGSARREAAASAVASRSSSSSFSPPAL